MSQPRLALTTRELRRLFAQGYDEGEVAGILGTNWLRTFMKFVE